MCAGVRASPPPLPPSQMCDALNRRRNRRGTRLRNPPCTYITGLLVPKGGQITVDYQVRPCDTCGAAHMTVAHATHMAHGMGQIQSSHASMRHHAAATQANTMWRTTAAGRQRHIKRLPVGMA